MSRTVPARSSPAIDRLVTYLMGTAEADPLADELAAWLKDSTRFRAFIEAHRDKVRKKVRTASDPDARRDVRAELRVAQLLLTDRHVELAFEAAGSTRGGPDFTVTTRGQRPFNLEVTRLRLGADANVAGSIVAKVRQLPPSIPNAVLLAIDAGPASAVDVAGAVRSIRQRAGAADDAYFEARGFGGARDFHRRIQRLGAVVVLADAEAGEARAASWTNGSARIAVPDRALRACLACLRSR